MSVYLDSYLAPFRAVAKDRSHIETTDPVHRFLRWVTIFSLFPAIGFLIPYGIVAKRVFPTVGLVPLFFSACSGVLQLAHKVGTRRNSFLMDLTIAALLVSCYVPGIVSLRFPRKWGRDTDVMGYSIPGVYGSVSLILNFCIHGFFVLRETYVGESVAWLFTPTPTCAHCHRHICSKKNPFPSDVDKESYRQGRSRHYPHQHTESLQTSTDLGTELDEESSRLMPHEAIRSQSGTYRDTDGATTMMSSTCCCTDDELDRMTIANGSTASGWTGVMRWLDGVTRKSARADDWRPSRQSRATEV